MQFITSLSWPAFLLLCAVACAVAIVLAAKHRKKWMPPLEELVTLDSRGWFFIATTATTGAVIMILTSQLFSSSYWLALAVDSDGKTIPDRWFPFGWFGLISVTTISALALSVMFELVADIGAPTASGLKKERKKGTPELLLIATAFAIVMSLASKWGFYEDKRNARAIEAAQIAATDAGAAERLAEAQATIDRLAGAPSVAIAEATENAIAAQLVDVTRQRAAATLARDALPADQGRNRLAYQTAIDTQTGQIGELERQKIDAQRIREDAAALALAREAKAAAARTLEADAGKLTEDKREIVKIGDLAAVRLIRAGLHQVLCFLFPIIALDAWATARKVRSRELAAAKGADTRRRNNPNAVFDADFEPPAAGDVPRFGGLLGREPPAQGEAPGTVTDAETDDGEPPREGEDVSGEGPSDDRR